MYFICNETLATCNAHQMHTAAWPSCNVSCYYCCNPDWRRIQKAPSGHTSCSELHRHRIWNCRCGTWGTWKFVRAILLAGSKQSSGGSFTQLARPRKFRSSPGSCRFKVINCKHVKNQGKLASKSKLTQRKRWWWEYSVRYHHHQSQKPKSTKDTLF